MDLITGAESNLPGGTNNPRDSDAALLRPSADRRRVIASCCSVGPLSPAQTADGPRAPGSSSAPHT